ncbi:MAG: membrane protein insertase YidC, partial [Myxococcota bacterium]
GAIFLFLQFGAPALGWDLGGDGGPKTQGISETNLSSAVPTERSEEQTCTLDGVRFRAELSTRGASLRHAWMTDDKYRSNAEDGASPAIDLVTTSLEAVMPLRTSLRRPGPEADQVDYDDVDYELVSSDGTSCVFRYRTDDVVVDKTVRSTSRPFELALTLTVTNQADGAKKHRLTVNQTDYRTLEDIEGSMGRVAELLTRTEVETTSETERFEPGDFDPGDFEDGEGFTSEQWRRVPGAARWVAVSSSYFTKALFPVSATASPAGEALIEHVWVDNRHVGNIYHARLNYGLQELAPNGGSATYEVLAYVGPKERQALASVGGEDVDYDAVNLLDLGVFSFIGKLLVSYLYLLYGFTKSWGWAICLLTITVKLLLFPLSIAQIKSSLGMRKLKPAIDELNKKYKDDPAQKAVAMQELMKKNNVTNPMLGCLPLLLQMPVWFALYTSLQTAVELYHTPFGPFIPDLSAPGKYFIIPAVLGASSFLQQHLMPMQGDPMQQKIMKYAMPAMFTVFMLFLPAGLGIYFLTNTWLGIGQQLFVEKFYRSREADDDSGSSSGPDDAEDRRSKGTNKPAVNRV